MKIVYCLAGTFNSGGMERIVISKANYLATHGYEVVILTTEQKKRPHFFYINPLIKVYDLGINYSDDANKNIFLKLLFFFIRRWKHKRKLIDYLRLISPDITISTFGNEVTFLHTIPDGSKKILEIHFSKYFRTQLNRSGLWRFVDILRSKHDERLVACYDKFVVLTQEDKTYWKNVSNIVVIPNFISHMPEHCSDSSNKICLAVGRLSYQKSFDRLFEVWKIVHERFPDWQLQIYGSGELYNELQTLIRDFHLQNVVKINPPTSHIGSVYMTSSIYLLSSHYEGLPMVMLEAFSYGIPVVSFACKCGPRDLIKDGFNGYLLPDGDITGFADKVMQLISNEEMRKRMGYNAHNCVSQEYTEDKIMNKWISLFHNL